MTPRRFDPLAYRAPRPVPWLIHVLGPVNRIAALGGMLRLHGIDFPAGDRARLRAAVNRDTAAFLGPHHPEFTTDWLLDKEISRVCSPLMAHWASWEIVNLGTASQAFFLANNLIANTPGGGGREYSIDWACRGHGVLLHPEGTASWHGDRVGRLLPGIVDMAWAACTRLRERADRRPVFLVPIVWKLHFTRDVGGELGREMGLIERALELPDGRGLALEARFAALQCGVLRRQHRRLGDGLAALPEDLSPAAFFAAQEAFGAALIERLEARYGRSDGDLARRQHLLRRAIREAQAADPDGARRDRAAVMEIERLQAFTRTHYSGPTLTQEHIAENLKRIRLSLIGRGFRNALHNVVPVAVASRVAHVRVPDPIAVHEAWTDDADEAERRRAALLDAHREAMQRALDDLNRTIAPVVDPYRRANPMGAAAAPATPMADP